MLDDKGRSVAQKRSLPRPCLARRRDVGSRPSDSARTLVLLMADNPSGLAIPAPWDLVAFQVDTAEPAIDAVQGNVIRSRFENIAVSVSVMSSSLRSLARVMRTSGCRASK